MSKISKKIEINLVPIIAIVLMNINQILVHSVTPPDSGGQPTRYLIYWLLFLVSSVGTNLIVLYLGYTSRQTVKPITKLSKIYFYLVSIGLIGILFSIIISNSFASQDLWLLLFPISHNDFQLASSILIWYVFGPMISRYVHTLSKITLNSITLLVFWFFLIMPFLFGKQLWGIESGSSFIWVGVLFLFGVLLNEINILSKMHIKSTILTIVFVLIVLLLFLKVSPLSGQAVDLRNRLFSNYSLPLFVFTILIFNLCNNITVIKSSKKRFKKLFSINWLFLTIFFSFTCQPLCIY
ncbi:hypothetical protein [Paucilactobacillus kaifaensis]|uniref:hypothetical protein n=1 Tax=Paucilactobacillus kaifaensis TaxID=2559921 RepID=UPI0010F6F9D3|nr:hypothetical protein [Paucilactobacillus kaifaensis]